MDRTYRYYFDNLRSVTGEDLDFCSPQRINLYCSLAIAEQLHNIAVELEKMNKRHEVENEKETKR